MTAFLAFDDAVYHVLLGSPYPGLRFLGFFSV